MRHFNLSVNSTLLHLPTISRMKGRPVVGVKRDGHCLHPRITTAQQLLSYK